MHAVYYDYYWFELSDMRELLVKVGHRITHDNINNFVKSANYAVRGAIVIRAIELMKDFKMGKSLPFKEIIFCNTGNSHSLGQQPISFLRNVLLMTLKPSLTESEIFPNDVKNRVKRYMQAVSSVGAYSESQGIFAVREEVAEFLKERDGHSASPSDIFLTNGASEGVKMCLQTLIQPQCRNGIMTPIPQYPLYSALCTLLDGQMVPYFLDESNNWSCSSEMLSNALYQAARDGIDTKALVVINPGNPTGQVLDDENILSIINWCRDEGICLLADEVYQENIWAKDKKFTSFRKVALDNDSFRGNNGLQLISFHSISKGFLGECGLRGGYFEMLGFDETVKAELYKLASISLGSNTLGQIAVGLMCRPPKPGDESYSLYLKERTNILESLASRAHKLSMALDKLEGVQCHRIDGAMYAFPSITLPTKAIKAAEEKGMAPDTFYCFELLENTGVVVVVPGSGFGQMNNTHHFRTTILPPEDKIDAVISLISHFHSNFMKRYA